MLDVYPVYLKLGWKHSVSCVSRTRPDQKHSRRTWCWSSDSGRRRCGDGCWRGRWRDFCRCWLAPQRAAATCWSGQRPAQRPHPTSVTLDRGWLGLLARDAMMEAMRWRRGRWVATWPDVRYRLVTGGRSWLCIWLCIWCVSASKSETHVYTRICTPHPVYLTN